MNKDKPSNLTNMGNFGKKFFCGKWCKCKCTSQLKLSNILGNDFPSSEAALSGTSTVYLSAYVASRISDGKWQAILTSGDFQNGYYIIYNPQTSTDPTMTVFDNAADATAYATSYYTSSANGRAIKAYDNHATVNVSTVYSNITAVSYNSNVYAQKFFPFCCKRV